jgi:hypothetical protein
MFDAAQILGDLEDHARRGGYFDVVNGHEPKSAPTIGAQVNVFFSSGPITPIQSSGLNSVSMRWEILARVFVSADSEPGDSIDPAVITATMSFLASLANAFSLNEQVRAVDFYGSDGEGLSAVPGYYDYDKITYRCMDLTIPVLINDVLPLSRS